MITLSNNSFFLFFKFLFLLKEALFFPPEYIGHETIAFRTLLLRSSYVELKSLDLEFSYESLAEGDKLDLAIATSLSDCSYSNFAIIKSGLFFFEISIALLRVCGDIKLISKFFSKELGSEIGPIIFS